MSRRSLMYKPSSLRSLEQERHQMRLAAPVLSGYRLRKEAWDRGTSSRQTVGNPPMVCQDPVVQNALYTGNVQAVKEIFSKGFPSDLVIQPQGGAMRWSANGKARGENSSCLSWVWLCNCLLEIRLYCRDYLSDLVDQRASGFWTFLKVMPGGLKIATI